ncbi:MAG: hypothetical protein PHQ89_01060 [Bacilli bacterium]|nr:hypothetical protein [Bacilli bacterium]
MRVFNKEKDLIHRIANLILIIWLLISILSVYSTLVSIIFNDIKYQSYKADNCIKEVSECKTKYEEYYYINNSEVNNKRNLFTYIGMTLIVGTSFYLINKSLKDKKGAKIND